VRGVRDAILADRSVRARISYSIVSWSRRPPLTVANGFGGPVYCERTTLRHCSNRALCPRRVPQPSHFCPRGYRAHKTAEPQHAACRGMPRQATPPYVGTPRIRCEPCATPYSRSKSTRERSPAPSLSWARQALPTVATGCVGHVYRVQMTFDTARNSHPSPLNRRTSTPRLSQAHPFRPWPGTRCRASLLP
jgi:hypothetical protein